MKLSRISSILIISPVIFLSLTSCFGLPKKEKPMHQVDTITDIQKLFDLSPTVIGQKVAQAEQEAIQTIQKIVTIPAHERTFANTPYALDYLATMSDFAVLSSVLQILEMSSSDAAVRQAAHDGTLKLNNMVIDHISNNKKLYNAFKEYVAGNGQKEQLSDEQKFYLDEVMKDFKRAGLDLPQETLDKIKEIKKELAKLTLDFDAAIAQDATKAKATKEQLAGLDEDFIKALPKNEDGTYHLGMDYPTYFKVMENCEVEDTRKRMYQAFNNRAYPANDERLKKIIALRDSMARLLGFPAYCHLDLDNQMVKCPDRAHQFLNDLIAKSSKKERLEIEELKKDLPPSVTLNAEGKLKPWDVAYISNLYKKKHFNVDESKIAEYFPMEKTIAGLLDIYRAFLSIDFEEIPVTGFWDKEVKLIKVFNKDHSQLLGYLLLDLFPRPNKYSHAAHAGVIPAMKYPDGTRSKTVSVVWANFPKSTAEKPSLLQRSDVKTFFHEFGHALHALLGVTEMGSFSGTSVKRDFVELPSQILEEWLNDKQMLQMVSGHYKTGEPLPDEVINNLLALKKVFSGNMVQRQAVLSLLALTLFGPGEEKDPYELYKDLQRQYSTGIAFDPENHMYASFGHLTGYGAKYYGYLWSRVFAQDVFEQIKKHGLLDPAIGQKYIDEIIGKGGSKDPDTLLENFLGRAPLQDAFLQDMGLLEEAN